MSLIWVLASPAASAAVTFNVTDIDPNTFGEVDFQATAINTHNQVVGYSLQTGKVYTWQNNAILDSLGNIGVPVDINNQRDVLVSTGSIVWSNQQGTYQPTPVVNVPNGTSLFYVDNLGQVSGISVNGSNSLIWSKSAPVDSPSNGTSTLINGDPSEITAVGGFASVNGAIQIAGSRSVSVSGFSEALVFQEANNTITILPLYPGSFGNSTEAYAINNMGQIVGHDSGNAVLWFNNGSPTSYTAVNLNARDAQNNFIYLNNPANVTLAQAFYINSYGQIVGQAGSTHSFVATPTTPTGSLQWIGNATTGSWSNPANWDSGLGFIPNPILGANIIAPRSGSVEVTGPVVATTTNNLSMGSAGGTGGVATLNLNGGVLTVTQAVTLLSNSRLALLGDNLLVTPSVVVNGGILDIGVHNESVGGVSLQNGSILGTGTMTSTSDYDLQSGTVSANLSGTVGLAKTTPGTVVLSGFNTYTGPTNVNAGILSLVGGSAIADTGVVNIDQTGTLNLLANETIDSLQGVTGSLVSLNANTLTMGDANDSVFAGAISGTGGLVKLGAGTFNLTGTNTYSGGTTVNAGTLQGNTSSLQGNIANNAAIVFDQTNNGTYGGNMSGTGSLTKQGTGLLNLTGSNSYSGGTSVNAGTLQGNTTSLQGSIANNAAVVFDQINNGTYSGAMSGTGSLTKQGTGLLNLTGANTYTGGTTVNAGALQGNTASIQGNVANNAAVNFDQINNGTYGGNMSGTGTLTKQGTGLLNLTGTNTYTGGTSVNAGNLQGNTASIQGNVANNAAIVFDQINNGTYGGNMSGTGLLTKQGTGLLNLTGSNTYSGGTSVNAGTLQGNTTSLQGNVANNAAIVFNQINDGTYGGNMSGTGSLTKQGTGLLNLTGTNTYSGGTSVSAGTLQGNTASIQGNVANNAAVIFNQTTDGTYSGTLSGTGSLTKQGTGLLNLTGTNTYSGGTTVNAGTLQGNTASIQGNIANNAAIVFDQINDGTYGGNMSGAGLLTKQGTGLLNLTGTNTYSGGTTVNAGTLQGNTASIQGNIANNAAIVFDQINDGTYGGNMSGTGSLTKQGAGSLVLTGTNTYSGDTIIASGSLVNQGTFNTPANLNILSGSVFNNESGNVIVNNGTIDNQGTLTNSGTLYNQGIFRNQSGGILNLPDGSQLLNGGTFTNFGTVNFQGNWENVGGSSPILNNQGTFNVSGESSHVIDGRVLNQGTFNVQETSVTFTGDFVNNGAYVSDPSINRFNNLSVGQTGYISAGPQDTFIINGNFANASTQNTQWNTDNANLVFASATPGQPAQHQMELAGADKGAKASGAVNNYTWGSVTLNNGDRLTLSDGNATPGAALYARQVNLPGGVGELANISSNYNVYFDPTLPANQSLLGGKSFGSGGGLLLPWDFVPFGPGTVNAIDLTPNARNFAAALDEACGSPSGALAARCVQLQGLSVPQQKQAIASLTPDQVTAQAATTIKLSATRMDAPISRLAALRAGGSAPFALNVNGMAIPINSSKWSTLFAQKTKGGGASADAEPFRDSPLGVYIQARFNFGDMDTSVWNRGFNTQTRNVTVGADYRFTDQLVMGLAFNYTNATTNYVNNSGRMDSDTYMGAFYGSYFLPHDIYVDWVANYGGNNYAFRRQFQYTGFVGQSNSSPSGNQYSFAVSGGKEFNWQEWLFNPYLRLEYLNLHIGAYDESGGGGLAVTTGGQTSHSLVTDLGLQISHAVSLPWGVVTPAFRVEWEHQYLNDNSYINMRLSDAAAGLGYFSVQTGNPSRDYVNLGGSFSAALPNGGGAFIRYETRLGQSYLSEHIVEGGVRLTF
jgi:autotransporter-associated beta strand protein